MFYMVDGGRAASTFFGVLGESLLVNWTDSVSTFTCFKHVSSKEESFTFFSALMIINEIHCLSWAVWLWDTIQPKQFETLYLLWQWMNQSVGSDSISEPRWWGIIYNFVLQWPYGVQSIPSVCRKCLKAVLSNDNTLIHAAVTRNQRVLNVPIYYRLNAPIG